MNMIKKYLQKKKYTYIYIYPEKRQEIIDDPRQYNNGI